MEHIAIIGIACRFPGARNAEAFWQLLRNGVDAITEVPEERWQVDDYYDADPAAPGKMTTRYAGFLDQVDQFDPYFFGISPREASGMDPQQRLLLEVAWEALEDGGQVLEQLAGSATGVFIGISNNDYRLELSDTKLIDPYVGTGNLFSIAAGRVSYLFNFLGPAIAIDTACSSSLISVHLACQSLLSGESTLALAGGVNVILSPASTIALSKMSALSPDGRCRTFDARANGYVRGEGAGFVVLKPLAQAESDGDQIYAVIRGSAVNHDGRSNGLTAPNGPSQAALIRRALTGAGVEPAQIDYVEAHGTGTPLGDPIEAEALGSVFSRDRSNGSELAVGSVKTNIGHLEAAAGIASLIKVALSLKHREIPPSLHFEHPNPYIDFEALRLKVQRSLGPWPADPGSAFAGVSSFGFSGTNAHVVLQEAPELALTSPPREQAKPDQARVLILSARSPEALRFLARSYRDLLVIGGSASTRSLEDLCYTACTRRSHHDYRLALAFHTWEELVEHFEIFLRDEASPWFASARRRLNLRPKLVFVFSGQGPQWWAMGRELMEQEPVFRETVEKVDLLMRQEAAGEWSLLDELSASESETRLDQTEIAQPAIFALQVALAALLRAWGVEPDAVVGHSMGEVAAAYVSGALSLADAVKIIVHRGRLMQPAMGQGKMAAVELSTAETEQALAGYQDRLSVAAVNSATSTVISGEPSALDEVAEALMQQKQFVQKLPVKYAFHSQQMDPFLDELEQTLAEIKVNQPTLPFISSVTGRVVDGSSLDAAYWRQNVRQPVLFAEAIGELLERGHDMFLELAPHPVLAGAISRCLQQHEVDGTVLPTLQREQSERAMLLASLGGLYVQGYPIDWRRLYPNEGRTVQLPSYPWQREHFWLQSAEPEKRRRPDRATQGTVESQRHPLLGRRLKDLAHLPESHFWEVEFDRENLSYLDDHRVLGSAVVPASVYLEMVLAAASEVSGTGPHSVAEVTLQNALFLPEDGSRIVQLILTPQSSEGTDFQILSRLPDTEGEWKKHAKGRIDHGKPEADLVAGTEDSLEEIRHRCTADVPVPSYYRRLAESGFEYGPSFQGIESLWRRDGEALGEIELPSLLDQETKNYQIHPALLDTCFQVLAATLPTNGKYVTSKGVYIPTRLRHVQVYRDPPSRLWSHARLLPSESSESDAFEGDIRLLDEAGQVVAEALNLRLQRWGRGLEETVRKSRARPAKVTAPRPSTPVREQDTVKTEKDARPTAAIPTREVLQGVEAGARQELLQSYLLQQVAKSMSISPSKLDAHRPLEDQGFDSLMAIEVKYRVESELLVDVPVRNLVERPTVVELAVKLEQLLQA